jgi:hypothetical protein
MVIRYTKHARFQMRVRRISRDEVEAVMADPAMRLPERGGRRHVLKRVAGRLLRVVSMPADPDCWIITAYAPEEGE